MELTQAQTDELLRLKSYFPYRIVYAAFHPETKAFEAYAQTTRRGANKLARQGYTVMVLQ